MTDETCDWCPDADPSYKADYHVVMGSVETEEILQITLCGLHVEWLKRMARYVTFKNFPVSEIIIEPIGPSTEQTVIIPPPATSTTSEDWVPDPVTGGVPSTWKIDSEASGPEIRGRWQCIYCPTVWTSDAQVFAHTRNYHFAGEKGRNATLEVIDPQGRRVYTITDTSGGFYQAGTRVLQSVSQSASKWAPGLIPPAIPVASIPVYKCGACDQSYGVPERALLCPCKGPVDQYGNTYLWTMNSG